VTKCFVFLENMVTHLLDLSSIAFWAPSKTYNFLEVFMVNKSWFLGGLKPEIPTIYRRWWWVPTETRNLTF